VDFEIVLVVKVLVVDLSAGDDVDFTVTVFELPVTVFLVVEEDVWWVVEVGDFEDEVFVESVEAFVAPLAEEVVEVETGHSRGGLESYPVRILFTAE
jgi:hypothetical protein